MLPLAAGSDQASFDLGPSGDHEAIAEAADDYVAGDPLAAATLAEAAAAADADPLTATAIGLAAGPVAEDSYLAVSDDGDLAISTDGMPDVGISFDGSTGAGVVVDGALVQPAVAESTDLVVRETDAGVQLVAVLGDDSAPTDLDFSFDLPVDSELVAQPDGTIAVFAPVEVEDITPAGLEELNAQIEGITGALTDIDQITEAQWEAIGALPEPPTAVVVKHQQIAEVGAAWAVDANGNPVETHYEVTADGLKQVIDVDEETAFPVVADPSWLWWVGTSVACLAELGAIAFAAAKVVNAFAKAEKVIKASKAMIKAYNDLGGKMSKVIDLVKKYIKKKTSLTKKQIASLETLSKSALSVAFNIIGLGSCYNLVMKG
ncbi:MAG: hypothetical protein LBK95_04060 [Bifidobacteriaceae bacterium]|jgi:hypothetical protein|nr:hypothetical protein [Bifidobacteriaceae bacterium]